MQRQESSPMEKLAAVKCSVAAEAGPRSDFLWPSDTDTVLSIVMALAGEVATLYERVDTIERVVEQELRSEEHTSELQSLMRISYAVFCLKKKKKQRSQNGHVCTKIRYEQIKL